MGFKIEKQAADEPKYCDYIQEKIDIARENGAVYDLVDEDYRIQALYNQENLVTKDKIKVINRVRSTDDGKEYLVVNKNVDFFTPNAQDPKKPGVYKDRYSTREGIVELPLKTTNPETGEVEVKQTGLVYTIPFSASKVDEYLEKAEDQVSIPQLTFYEGATTSNRLPSNIPTVGNQDYFKDATWTELLLGKEKKVINSMVNRLPEIRKDNPQQIKAEEKKAQEVIERKEISPKDEVNKPVAGNEDIVKSSSSSGSGGSAATKGFGGSAKKN